MNKIEMLKRLHLRESQYNAVGAANVVGDIINEVETGKNVLQCISDKEEKYSKMGDNQVNRVLANLRELMEEVVPKVENILYELEDSLDESRVCAENVEGFIEDIQACLSYQELSSLFYSFLDKIDKGSTLYKILDDIFI